MLNQTLISLLPAGRRKETNPVGLIRLIHLFFRTSRRQMLLDRGGAEIDSDVESVGIERGGHRGFQALEHGHHLERLVVAQVFQRARSER
jgi:hypothetical protein